MYKVVSELEHLHLSKNASSVSSKPRSTEEFRYKNRVDATAVFPGGDIEVMGID